MNDNTPRIIDGDMSYYKTAKPIGIFVLSNSLKEQRTFEETLETQKVWLYLINDWTLIFLCLERLKKSIEKNERWNIALDTTSFYLLARIYFDSLASITHFLLKLTYPSNSRMWPPAASFSDQLKWLSSDKAPKEYIPYISVVKRLAIDEFFVNFREFRNALKTAPHTNKSKRMAWNIMSNSNIKTDIGKGIYEIIRISDLLGDFLFLPISLKYSLKRMEETHHGYPIGLLNQDQLNLYSWFITK